mgnify:CR=1 FL=1
MWFEFDACGPVSCSFVQSDIFNLEQERHNRRLVKMNNLILIVAIVLFSSQIALGQGNSNYFAYCHKPIVFSL